MKYLMFIIVLLISNISFAQNNVVKITIYNPYSISARMEIKCNHNWKTNKFTYHQFIFIRGKKNMTISVPNNLTECQVWPKIIW